MTTDREDGWIVRVLFGISSDPAQRARDLIRVYLGLVLGTLLTALFLYLTIQGPRFGLPDQSALVEKHGTLQEASEVKSTVYFSLTEYPDKFDYQSKAGDGTSVFHALHVGALVKVWHEPLAADYRVGDDRLTVFQIEADGSVVRSYDQVEEAWVANNSVSPWLVVLFGASTAYLVAYIWLAWRR